MPALVNAAALFAATNLLPPQALTTAANGPAFDTLDYDGEVLVVQSVGALSGAAPTTKLQASVDAAFTSPVDVPDGAFATVGSAPNVQYIAIDLDAIGPPVASGSAQYRYIRWSCTAPGTSITVSAVVAGLKHIR